jgi:diguanylate cyclase (GGDEF)-like protein
MLAIALALTNEHHHLLWSSIAPSSTSSSAPLIYSYGPAARVLAAFNYVLLGWTCYLLVSWARHTQPLYRRQAAVLIACIAAIVVSSLLYTVRWIGVPALNLLPLSFTLTGVLVYLALFRFRLLDLVPVARAMLVESMVDGVLVIDARGRIVDSNSAALRFLSASGLPLAGMDVRDTLGEAALQLSATDGSATSGFEMSAPADSQLRVEVQAIPLRVREIDSGLLLVLRDITQKWRAETALRTQLERNLVLQATLREQAIRDALTGLFNRRFLEESLARELAVASRAGTSMALVLIDLDHFKTVNDRFGHVAGDRVLQAVAALLQHGTRAGNVVCRFGGEEFVVLLPTAEAADALRRAECWRHDVEVLRVEYEGTAIGVTFSAGVSAYPSCGSDVDEILRAGDRAMYEAKSAGRNRVFSLSRKAPYG